MTTPNIMSFTIVDSEGVQATLPLYFTTPTTATVAQLQTAVDTYAPVVDKVTDGQILDARMILNMSLPTGLKGGAATGSNVESTGLLNFSQAGSKYKFGIDIPAIAAAAIVNGKIDLSNTDVQTFITAVTTVTTLITVVSKFTNALQGLLDALRTFRRHAKALTRRSFEQV